MAISNVALTNTFDQWRLVTNQTVVALNDVLDDGLQTYRNVKANVISGNTIYANGVDVITLPTAAFVRANAANLIANLAFDKANTANVIASGAFDKANTACTKADAAQSTGSAAFDQANTANVVAVSAFNAANTGVPSGVIMPYAGSSEPTGWLLCSGNAVSRTTYSSLYSAIGTTYGSGDGVNTFNLPDLRGRVVAGRDDMGGTAALRVTASGSNANSGIAGTTLGANGGTQTHILTTAQLPTFNIRSTTSTTNPAFGDNTPLPVADDINTTVGENYPHQNMQPTMILNYIIKT
jgi:microcystin-dependent protein